ncbi:RNA polymerase sigma factor RpoH [Telmatospirillum siberiense]|uniref:RNA polymerase sigma factor n=1 Tax=Telmatospirillum siberiense TaxID=382514 RepID=A0A2N3PTH4_9PROT|nr:RNA polymerase sigma factor RpoH [Telmatospirillum siberiense]PKU23705.1 RNA polymerase sigma factor RpoH [Telmatospirillum siberiense]
MAAITNTLPVLSPDGGLSKYLREIRSFPVLPPEEEYMLAKRWQEHEDVDAAHRLVTSHLRLVAKMALGFRHYGLPLSDLISEGNLGLMRAVKKFDPDKGFRLATYAMWWIKAALHEYVLSSWSMVRLGTLAAHKKLFFNLRRVKAKLHILDSTELTHEDTARIAAELDVPEDQVRLMNQRIGGRDSSLNAPVSSEFAIERQDLLVDDRPNQEVTLSEHEETTRGNALLAEGFKVLDKRERDILTERRLRDAPLTLEELGVRYGISRERVRQIENRAFAKLQSAVKATALDRRGSLEAMA